MTKSDPRKDTPDSDPDSDSARELARPSQVTNVVDAMQMAQFVTMI